jgi:hypothetical protein
MQVMTDKFEPADYSIEELQFIKEHMGETPNVALHGELPDGVNPAAIQVALGRFSELDELSKIKATAKRKPQPWAGYEAIEDSIDRFIAWHDKSLKIQAQGGPRHPSMHSWDSTGAMSTGGIGTDSVEKVRTEILDDGTRRPFAVDLLKLNGKSPDMPWVKKHVAADRIVHNENGTYQCTICNKIVATYDTDAMDVRKARNRSRAEAVKHLKNARREVSRHRAIINVPFD